MALPRLPGALQLLEVELEESKKDDSWTRPSDPFGEHAEAELLALWMPRATSNFTSDYKGSHFQNLPAELLQAIALQMSIAPGLISSLHKHFGTFRTLCRESNEAGKALLLARAHRNRYSVPHTLSFPPIGHSVADLTKLFTNNVLAALVTNIQFTFRPLITHTRLKDVLVQSGSLVTSKDASLTADKIMNEFRTQMERQEAFVDELRSEAGFQQFLQLLNLFPKLEELTYRVLDFWRLINDAEVTETLIDTPREGAQVVHWRALSRAMEVVKHCNMTHVNIDADSSMFGEPSQGVGVGLPRRSNRRSGVVDKLSLPEHLHHLTTLNLTMSRQDKMSLGRYYDSDMEDLRNARAFKDFLMCAVDLRKLLLEYATEEQGFNKINSEWLGNVLGGIHLPALRTFELHAAVDSDKVLIDFFTTHRHTLRSVTLYEISLPCPGDAVELVNVMRNGLSLQFCSITNFDFFPFHLGGEDDYLQIIRLYRNNPPAEDDLDDLGDLEDDVDIDFGVYVLGHECAGRLIEDYESTELYIKYKDGQFDDD